MNGRVHRPNECPDCGHDLQNERCSFCGFNAPVTDGGFTPLQAIARVLVEARPGGLERDPLIERAAEVGEVTRERAEDALEELRRPGEVYDIDGEYKLTPKPDAEQHWRGFS